MREAVLVRDGLCVWCLNEARATEATEADHVVPMERCYEYDIDPHDPSNIVGSCRSCNARRASYTAKGVFFESIEGWQKFLRERYIHKLNRVFIVDDTPEKIPVKQRHTVVPISIEG